MKFKHSSIVLAALFTLLIGCQANTDDNMEEGRMDNDNMFERTGYNDEMNREGRMNDLNDNFNGDNVNNRNDNRGNNNKNNNQYDVAEKAADKITEQIKEIDQAYVLKTDNNAYVAAMLDNDRNNNNNRMNENGTNNNQNNNDGNNGMTGNNIANNNQNIGNDRGNGDELTDEVKSKIKDIVQSVDKDIDNVYVTTNPDFADLTNNYINDMDEGKPVRGFFDQIGNAIERIFPQNND